jgi:hypothetical protein
MRCGRACFESAIKARSDFSGSKKVSFVARVSQPAHPPKRELVAEKGEDGLSLSSRNNGEEHALAAWASRRRGFPSSPSIPLLLSRRRFSWWLCIRTVKVLKSATVGGKGTSLNQNSDWSQAHQLPPHFSLPPSLLHLFPPSLPPSLAPPPSLPHFLPPSPSLPRPPLTHT